jgi:hypothetical protein
MTPDRLDDLLARALESGSIPEEATADERAELQPLLERARALQLNAARVRSEADAAVPSARARFQRHLANQAAGSPAAVALPPKPGWMARFLGGRGMALAGSAAAVAVVAVVALAVLRPFDGPETALALTVDDYVQVHGVVSAAGEGTVTVQAPEIGHLEVALSELTSVTDTEGARPAASLRPGDPVLVSGVVTDRRAIAASNVAVSGPTSAPSPIAGQEKLPLLREIKEPLVGSVNLLALSPDGTRARVLVVTANRRFLVDVDPRSMDQFLADHPGAIGARVRVVADEALPRGVFRLQPAGGTGPAPTPNPVETPGPEFQDVRGVVIGRAAATLMVQTDRGVVPVVIRPLTSIRFGDSGLTPDDIRSGESVVGYEVSISGNAEVAGGRRVIASIIIVLGEAPQRPLQR